MLFHLSFGEKEMEEEQGDSFINEILVQKKVNRNKGREWSLVEVDKIIIQNFSLSLLVIIYCQLLTLNSAIVHFIQRHDHIKL